MKRQFQAFSYKVENKADNTLDVHIDGIIADAETQEILKNWFGDETSTSFKSFRNQVQTAKPKVINIFINSGGGMVTDAMAIRDFLTAQEAEGVIVNRKGVGLVASAATFILMGKNSSMSENSFFMIHNVSGGVFGDVNMIESYAKTIRKFNDQTTAVYTAATGLSATVIGNMMDVETWLTAAEAKEKGFINSIDGAATFKNKISQDAWPYSNMAVLNSYNAAVKEPNAPVAEHTSFFTDLKNWFMNFKEQLTASATAAKADDKFKNLTNRDEIVSLVESMVTPLVNKIDEHIAAVKPAETSPAATATTAVTPAATAATPAASATPAATPAAATAVPAAAEAQETGVEKLRREFTDFKNAFADKAGKPIAEGDRVKNVESKFKVEYGNAE